MERPLLPSEIFLQILRFADKSTLKSLRQCTRWFETQITPVLFQKLVVVPYSSSFEGIIEHLASNPRIRDVVEHIRYDTHCVGPEPLKLSDQSYLTAREWSNDTARLNQIYPGYSEYVSSLDACRFPLSMSDDFRRLVRLSPEDRIEVDSFCEMNFFTALLEAFPRVTKISLTNSILSRIKWCSMQLRPVPYFYRKWFDDHKRSMETSDPNLSTKPYSVPTPYVGSQRAEFLLLSLCNHRDRRFELEIDEILGHVFTGLYAFDDVRVKWDNECLRNVESLKLHFHEWSDQEYRHREAYYTLAHLLAHNQNMRELSIAFHDPTSGAQQMMSDILDSGTFPPLRQLTLGHVTLPGGQLVDVLKLMSSTLRSVKLEQIVLHDAMRTTTTRLQDSWIYVIKSMSEHLRLDQVEFLGILKAHNQHLIVPDWDYAYVFWEFKKAKRIGSKEVLWLSRVLNQDLYEYLSALKFDEQRHFTRDSCLSSRIGQYITHRGAYPDELVEIEAAMAREAREDTVSYWSACYGDCSWLMGV